MAKSGRRAGAKISGDGAVIFVTVGTQLPFDRLVEAVDHWASRSEASQVFAQIGHGEYLPQHMEWQRELEPKNFKSQLSRATAVVAHAGIGTILSGLELGKPVIILPRRADLGEHRNDHQLATAREFDQMGLVTVAENQNDLQDKLESLTSMKARQQLRPEASQNLLDYIQSFIAEPPALR